MLIDYSVTQAALSRCPSPRNILSSGFKIFFLAFFLQILSAAFLRAENWKALPSGVVVDLNSVFFISDTAGWAVGASGTILITSNGGATWTAQTSGTSTILRDVRFTRSSTGCVVGSNGYIGKTDNYGSTWTAVASGVTRDLYAFHAPDVNTFYAVGDQATVRKSSDSGTTWYDGASGIGITDNLRGVFFADKDTGWIVGDAGVIRKTADGGSNWGTQTSGTSENLKSVFFVSASTGWVVGVKTILKTVDGGSLWTSQLTTTASLNSVMFVSSDTGWTVGDSNTILYSSNAALNFSQDSSSFSFNLSKVFSPSETVAFAVGAFGTILLRGVPVAAVVASTADVQQGGLTALNNLFDPSKGEATTLQYANLRSGRITVRIYTMQGRLVRTLIDENKDSGTYAIDWNGKNDGGEIVATGIYLAHIEGPELSISRKIAIVQ